VEKASTWLAVVQEARCARGSAPARGMSRWRRRVLAGCRPGGAAARRSAPARGRSRCRWSVLAAVPAARWRGGVRRRGADQGEKERPGCRPGGAVRETECGGAGQEMVCGGGERQRGVRIGKRRGFYALVRVFGRKLGPRSDLKYFDSTTRDMSEPRQNFRHLLQFSHSASTGDALQVRLSVAH
jgi:hypothetical protein